MIVSSTQLARTARLMRLSGREVALLNNGVNVSARQLLRAAQILHSAEPCVIDRPRSLRSVEERPGFIEPESQDDPEVLVFQVGIIPGELHRIDRTGRVIP